MRSSRPRRRDRNASVTLEFILVLPFLVVTLFAVAQYSVALLVRQAVTHAAIVGAREAGKYEDIEQVARVVDAVLDGAHNIDVATVTVVTPATPPSTPATTTVTPVAGSGVQIILEVGGGTTSYFPNPPALTNCAPPATPSSPASDEVRVTVCIDLGRRPMCNWLFKFSPDYVNFSNRCFSVSSLVKKE